MKKAIFVLIGLFCLFWMVGNVKPPPSAAEKAAKCGADDLDCVANAVRIEAGQKCQDQIERRAKFSAEWTHSGFDGIFRQYQWANKNARTLTLSGDKVKFQNGFGAWQIMSYRCDYDPAKGAVLDVRVSEGRLPN
jgi:hypothetical protein